MLPQSYLNSTHNCPPGFATLVLRRSCFIPHSSTSPSLGGFTVLYTLRDFTDLHTCALADFPRATALATYTRRLLLRSVLPQHNFDSTTSGFCRQQSLEAESRSVLLCLANSERRRTASFLLQLTSSRPTRSILILVRPSLELRLRPADMTFDSNDSPQIAKTRLLPSLPRPSR